MKLILLFYVVSSLATAISSLLLGIFVYFRNRNNLTNKSWLLMSMSISVWTLGYCAMISGGFNHETTLFLDRVSHIGAIFIPLFYLKFVISLLQETKKYNRINRFCTITSVLFIFTVFSKYFISDVVAKYYFKYYPVPGAFYLLFTLYFFTVIVYAQCLLFFAIKKTT